jgi:hypothetical protein
MMIVPSRGPRTWLIVESGPFQSHVAVNQIHVSANPRTEKEGHHETRPPICCQTCRRRCSDTRGCPFILRRLNPEFYFLLVPAGTAEKRARRPWMLVPASVRGFPQPRLVSWSHITERYTNISRALQRTETSRRCSWSFGNITRTAAVDP